MFYVQLAEPEMVGCVPVGHAWPAEGFDLACTILSIIFN